MSSTPTSSKRSHSSDSPRCTHLLNHLKAHELTFKELKENFENMKLQQYNPTIRQLMQKIVKDQINEDSSAFRTQILQELQRLHGLWPEMAPNDLTDNMLSLHVFSKIIHKERIKQESEHSSLSQRRRHFKRVKGSNQRPPPPHSRMMQSLLNSIASSNYKEQRRIIGLLFRNHLPEEQIYLQQVFQAYCSNQQQNNLAQLQIQKTNQNVNKGTKNLQEEKNIIQILNKFPNNDEEIKKIKSIQFKGSLERINNIYSAQSQKVIEIEKELIQSKQSQKELNNKLIELQQCIKYCSKLLNKNQSQIPSQMKNFKKKGFKIESVANLSTTQKKNNEANIVSMIKQLTFSIKKGMPHHKIYQKNQEIAPLLKENLQELIKQCKNKSQSSLIKSTEQQVSFDKKYFKQLKDILEQSKNQIQQYKKNINELKKQQIQTKKQISKQAQYIEEFTNVSNVLVEKYQQSKESFIKELQLIKKKKRIPQQPYQTYNIFSEICLKDKRQLSQVLQYFKQIITRRNLKINTKLQQNFQINSLAPSFGFLLEYVNIQLQLSNKKQLSVVGSSKSSSTSSQVNKKQPVSKEKSTQEKLDQVQKTNKQLSQSNQQQTKELDSMKKVIEKLTLQNTQHHQYQQVVTNLLNSQTQFKQIQELRKKRSISQKYSYLLQRLVKKDGSGKGCQTQKNKVVDKSAQTVITKNIQPLPMQRVRTSQQSTSTLQRGKTSMKEQGVQTQMMKSIQVQKKARSDRSNSSSSNKTNEELLKVLSVISLIQKKEQWWKMLPAKTQALTPIYKLIDKYREAVLLLRKAELTAKQEAHKEAHQVIQEEKEIVSQCQSCITLTNLKQNIRQLLKDREFFTKEQFWSQYQIPEALQIILNQASKEWRRKLNQEKQISKKSIQRYQKQMAKITETVASLTKEAAEQNKNTKRITVMSPRQQKLIELEHAMLTKIDALSQDKKRNQSQLSLLQNQIRQMEQQKIKLKEQWQRKQKEWVQVEILFRNQIESLQQILVEHQQKIQQTKAAQEMMELKTKKPFQQVKKKLFNQNIQMQNKQKQLHDILVRNQIQYQLKQHQHMIMEKQYLQRQKYLLQQIEALKNKQIEQQAIQKETNKQIQALKVQIQSNVIKIQIEKNQIAIQTEIQIISLLESNDRKIHSSQFNLDEESQFSKKNQQTMNTLYTDSVKTQQNEIKQYIQQLKQKIIDSQNEVQQNRINSVKYYEDQKQIQKHNFEIQMQQMLRNNTIEIKRCWQNQILPQKLKQTEDALIKYYQQKIIFQSQEIQNKYKKQLQDLEKSFFQRQKTATISNIQQQMQVIGKALPEKDKQIIQLSFSLAKKQQQLQIAAKNLFQIQCRLQQLNYRSQDVNQLKLKYEQQINYLKQELKRQQKEGLMKEQELELKLMTLGKQFQQEQNAALQNAKLDWQKDTLVPLLQQLQNELSYKINLQLKQQYDQNIRLLLKQQQIKHQKYMHLREQEIISKYQTNFIISESQQQQHPQPNSAQQYQKNISSVQQKHNQTDPLFIQNKNQYSQTITIQQMENNLSIRTKQVEDHFQFYVIPQRQKQWKEYYEQKITTQNNYLIQNYEKQIIKKQQQINVLKQQNIEANKLLISNQQMHNRKQQLKELQLKNKQELNQQIIRELKQQNMQMSNKIQKLKEIQQRNENFISMTEQIKNPICQEDKSVNASFVSQEQIKLILQEKLQIKIKEQFYFSQKNKENNNIQINLKFKFQPQLKQDMQKQLKKQIYTQIKKNIGTQIIKITNTQITKEIQNQIKMKLINEIRFDIEKQVRENCQKNLRLNLEREFRQNIQKQIRIQLQNQFNSIKQKSLSNNLQIERSRKQLIQKHIQKKQQLSNLFQNELQQQNFHQQKQFINKNNVQIQQITSLKQQNLNILIEQVKNQILVEQRLLMEDQYERKLLKQIQQYRSTIKLQIERQIYQKMQSQFNSSIQKQFYTKIQKQIKQKIECEYKNNFKQQIQQNKFKQIQKQLQTRLSEKYQKQYALKEIQLKQTIEKQRRSYQEDKNRQAAKQYLQVSIKQQIQTNQEQIIKIDQKSNRQKIQRQIQVQIEKQIRSNYSQSIINKVQHQIRQNYTQQIMIKVQHQIRQNQQKQIQIKVQQQIRSDYEKKILSKIQQQIRLNYEQQIIIKVQQQIRSDYEKKILSKIQQQIRLNYEQQILIKVQQQIRLNYQQQILNKVQKQMRKNYEQQILMKIQQQIKLNYEKQLLVKVQQQIRLNYQQQILNKVQQQIRLNYQQQILNKVQQQIRLNYQQQILNKVQQQIRLNYQQQIINKNQQQIRQSFPKQVLINNEKQMTLKLQKQISQKLQSQLLVSIEKQIRQNYQQQIMNKVERQIRQNYTKQIMNKVEHQIKQNHTKQIMNKVYHQIRQNEQKQILIKIQQQIRSNNEKQILIKVEQQIKSNQQQQILNKVERQIRQNYTKQIINKVQLQIRQNQQRQILIKIQQQIRSNYEKQILIKVQQQIRTNYQQQILIKLQQQIRFNYEKKILIEIQQQIRSNYEQKIFFQIQQQIRLKLQNQLILNFQQLTQDNLLTKNCFLICNQLRKKCLLQPLVYKQQKLQQISKQQILNSFVHEINNKIKQQHYLSKQKQLQMQVQKYDLQQIQSSLRQKLKIQISNQIQIEFSNKLQQQKALFKHMYQQEQQKQFAIKFANEATALQNYYQSLLLDCNNKFQQIKIYSETVSVQNIEFQQINKQLSQKLENKNVQLLDLKIQNAMVAQLREQNKQLNQLLIQQRAKQFEDTIDSSQQMALIHEINQNVSQITLANSQLQTKLATIQGLNTLSHREQSIVQYFVTTSTTTQRILTYLIDVGFIIDSHQYKEFLVKSSEILMKGNFKEYFIQWQMFMRELFRQIVQSRSEEVKMYSLECRNLQKQSNELKNKIKMVVPKIQEKYKHILQNIRGRYQEYSKMNSIQNLIGLQRAIKSYD